MDLAGIFFSAIVLFFVTTLAVYVGVRWASTGPTFLAKKCEYCAEFIRYEASVCKFCHREVGNGVDPERRNSDSDLNVTENRNPFVNENGH